MVAFERVMLDHFQDRDGNKAIRAFLALSAQSDFSAEHVLIWPVFLALIMENNPSLAPDLVAGAVDPVHREIVAQALNYTNLETRKTLMQSLLGDAAVADMEEDGADFLTFPATHPLHVDMLWAAYFATGNADYVLRIASFLDGWVNPALLEGLFAQAKADESVQYQAIRGLMAAAAETSLSINAKDLPEVAVVLGQVAARNEGLMSALASRILASCPTPTLH